MLPHSRRLASAFAVLALALALPVSATPALAHAHLRSAAPAVNATVAAGPSELDLTFSEGVNPTFSGVVLTGPDGKAVPTGAGTLGAGGDRILVVPIPAPLAAGRYRVNWHALAADGHKTSGSYAFTVKP